MDEKEAALRLYLDDWSQAKIAQTLGVESRTVSRWKKKYDWDKQKAQKSVIAQNSTDTVWDLIHWQTKALNSKIKEYEKAAKNGDGFQLIDKGDIDALQKLFTIVKKKETEWFDIVKVSTELLEFIQSKDLKLAKKIKDLVTLFIDENRKSK